jgi:NTP pyrophosphatase (non-canonical NTP hydrolase)
MVDSQWLGLISTMPSTVTMDNRPSTIDYRPLTIDRHTMTLRDSQARVDAWISQFEEGYFPPLTNMARLSEEVGELAREINHRFGQKTKKKDEPEGDLAMEMADILFVIICMANREGIDLQEAFDRMMAKVEHRDTTRWTKKGR